MAYKRWISLNALTDYEYQKAVIDSQDEKTVLWQDLMHNSKRVYFIQVRTKVLIIEGLVCTGSLYVLEQQKSGWQVDNVNAMADKYVLIHISINQTTHYMRMNAMVYYNLR